MDVQLELRSVWATHYKVRLSTKEENWDKTEDRREEANNSFQATTEVDLELLKMI